MKSDRVEEYPEYKTVYGKSSVATGILMCDPKQTEWGEPNQMTEVKGSK